MDTEEQSTKLEHNAVAFDIPKRCTWIVPNKCRNRTTKVVVTADSKIGFFCDVHFRSMEING